MRLQTRFTALLGLYYILGTQLSIYDYTLRKDFAQFDTSITDFGWTMLIMLCPWQFKAVLALISDRFGFRGRHRKPYIIVCNFLAMICVSFLTMESISKDGYIAAMFFYNLFISWSDVCLDACVVEDSKDEPPDKKGVTQTFMIRSRLLGDTVGGVMGPVLWKYVGSNGVFGMLAGVCAKGFIMGILLKEPARVEEPDDVKQGVYKMVKAACSTLNDPIFRGTLIFMLITGLLPSAGIAMFYYFTEELDFTPEFMSLLSLLGGILRFIALTFVYPYLKRFKIRRMYAALAIMGFILSGIPVLLTYQIKVIDADVDYFRQKYNMTTNDTIYAPLSDILGLNNYACAIASDPLDQAIDELKNMPIYNLAALACDKKVAGGAYALVMSLLNLVGGLRRVIDNHIMKALGIDHYKSAGLWILVLICSLSELLPVIPDCFLVPDASLEELAKDKEAREAGVSMDVELKHEFRIEPRVEGEEQEVVI